MIPCVLFICLLDSHAMYRKCLERYTYLNSTVTTSGIIVRRGIRMESPSVITPTVKRWQTQIRIIWRGFIYKSNNYKVGRWGLQKRQGMNRTSYSITIITLAPKKTGHREYQNPGNIRPATLSGERINILTSFFFPSISF